MSEIEKLRIGGLEDEYLRSIADVQSLIDKVIEYEKQLELSGLQAVAGGFGQMDISEKDLQRAELVADLIRLSAGNTGSTEVYFAAGLNRLTERISNLKMGSIELLGTYLAAQEICKQDALNEKISGFDQLLRKTMFEVMQCCVDVLGDKAKTAVLATANSNRMSA